MQDLYHQPHVSSRALPWDFGCREVLREVGRELSGLLQGVVVDCGVLETARRWLARLPGSLARLGFRGLGFRSLGV